MPKKAGPNQKAVAAAEKKAAAQSVKDSKVAVQKEKELEAEWNQGANMRSAVRAESAAQKADEAARKKREKAALLAEEEADLGSGGKPKKTPTLSKGKGKKKGNDLSLLENALVKGAEKKMKATKQAEREKAEKLKAEQAKKKEEDAKPMDPLLASTQEMIRGTADDLVGRNANKALDEENAASGIDGALSALNIGGGPSTVPSAKALYKAFEERMMPEVKADYPNLKLSQYKDKIFQLWKKSPENPANQPKV
jgi:hypothetical protein